MIYQIVAVSTTLNDLQHHYSYCKLFEIEYLGFGIVGNLVIERKYIHIPCRRPNPHVSFQAIDCGTDNQEKININTRKINKN